MRFVELIRVVGCRLSQHFNRTEEASSRKAYVWLGAKRPLNKLQARALTWEEFPFPGYERGHRILIINPESD